MAGLLPAHAAEIEAEGHRTGFAQFTVATGPFAQSVLTQGNPTVPLGLSNAFGYDQGKQGQWRAFVERNEAPQLHSDN